MTNDTKAPVEADNALVDKYRDPKTGIFKFPDDVAAIIRRLERERDEALAAQGALIERAAMEVQMIECYECSHHGPDFRSGFHDHTMSGALRAITPADATAALEAVRREERAKVYAALREFDDADDLCGGNFQPAGVFADMLEDRLG